MHILRGLLGFLAGYIFVVLVTTLGFGVLPDRPIHTGTPLVMIAAALVAIIAGIGGGALATWIARNRLVGALVLLPLIAETYWLLFLRKTTPPADWRDAAAALTLLAAVAIGAYFAPKTISPPTTV